MVYECVTPSEKKKAVRDHVVVLSLNSVYQGRRGWFFKLGCEKFTSIMFCDMTSVM